MEKILAIVLGLAIPQAHVLFFLNPFLLGLMMVITFSSPVPKQTHGVTFRMEMRAHLISAALILLLWGAFRLLGFSQDVLLAGVVLCLAPPANAAPTVAKVLGGNAVLALKVYLVGNVVACFSIPLVLGLFTHGSGDFWGCVKAIFNSVQPIIAIPLALALGFRAFYPEIADFFARLQKHSLHIWTASVFCIIAKAGHDIREMGVEKLWENGTLLQIALLSAGLCGLLYFLGWVTERRGHPIEAMQSLGQKNTLLVLWAAQLYAGPIASLGPVFYVVWQNIVLALLIRNREKLKAREGAASPAGS